MKSDLNFDYPLLAGWDTEDIIKVSALYSAVAKAYESGVAVEQLLTAYQGFKVVVTSKSEEKQLGRQFETMSGYSIYKTIQAARQTNKKQLIMEG
ncbi:UPF0223 family protein [Weissella coleopterorum]|uniref:UPF0223 family protein n=1 Tax=Weissella coleopterorum TaxID=2714949 RepID=A0A6G8B047_9LACO|nr:UPF0223 family protein [Weissella coleopterorum]QIL50684.1 UPF0223 family protein [Weissella coleopterorum]